MILESKRLVLRLFENKDKEKLIDLLNDKYISKRWNLKIWNQ